MRRLSVASRLVAVVGLLALLISACGGDGDTLTLTAEFDDVMDMTANVPVYVADVEVGSVTDIELSDDLQALVTMEVRDDTGLPSEVEAVVEQSSLLGERIVELLPMNEAGELQDGRIEQTRIKTDLEQLVTAGNEVLGYVAADQLHSAVIAGSVTFGGRGGVLGQAITNVEAFVGQFDRRSESITRLLDNFDELLGILAEASETNAAAVEALARSNQALMEEDERLLDALEDARRLAVVGERILRENRQSLDEFFAQIEVIVKSLTSVQGALDGLLTYLPRHNLHVPNAEMLEFVQIWQDNIVCGTSAEDPDNPAKSCNPPNPGESNERPDFHEHDACDKDHESCEGYPEGTEPGTRNEPSDYGDDAEGGS